MASQALLLKLIKLVTRDAPTIGLCNVGCVKETSMACPGCAIQFMGRFIAMDEPLVQGEYSDCAMIL